MGAGAGANDLVGANGLLGRDGGPKSKLRDSMPEGAAPKKTKDSLKLNRVETFTYLLHYRF